MFHPLTTRLFRLWSIDYVPLFSGDAVVNVYINHEKKFAFVEMRSVEEASNAMALDGIMFEACLTLIFSLSWH